MTAIDYPAATVALTGKSFLEIFGVNPPMAVFKQDEHGVVSISHWDAALGAQPTIEALAATTLSPTPPASVSRRQFFQAAAQQGLITEAEALASGAYVPSSLRTAIAALPAAQQFAAQMAVLYAQDFERANPLVAAIGAAMGQDPAQIDALFILAASL